MLSSTTHSDPSFGSIKKRDFAGECLNASVDGADVLPAKGAVSCITVSSTKCICMTVVGFASLNELLASTGAGFEHPQQWRCFSTWNRLNVYIQFVTCKVDPTC